jgi:hypothetical protein
MMLGGETPAGMISRIIPAKSGQLITGRTWPDNAAARNAALQEGEEAYCEG